MPKKESTVTSPWYNMKDLERLFSVGERTIQKWVSSGKLPAPVRKGRRWTRWPKHLVDAVLEEWGAHVPEGGVV